MCQPDDPTSCASPPQLGKQTKSRHKTRKQLNPMIVLEVSGRFAVVSCHPKQKQPTNQQKTERRETKQKHLTTVSPWTILPYKISELIFIFSAWLVVRVLGCLAELGE